MMKNAKSGVAVIIVLGLLALLMVLAVTFSTTMRIERAGAANYATAVAGRQLAWAGLARAIDGINRTISDDMFPSADYLVSGFDAWGTNSGSGVLLLTKQVLDYVPDIMHGYSDIRAEWVPLDNNGQVAYIVLNLSDMLDINHVGGAPRMGGTNANEVSLNQWLSPAQINAIAAAREADPYITLANFRNRHEGLNADYFVTESKFRADASPVSQVDISGTFSDLEERERRNQIIAGLHAMLIDRDPGLAPPPRDRGGALERYTRNLQRITDSIFDYLDRDSPFPRRLDGPNVKTVPLLNEVILRGSPEFVISQDADTNEITVEAFTNVTLTVENWLPRCDMPDVPNFEVHADVAIRLVLVEDGAAEVYRSPAVTNTVELSSSSFRRGRLRRRDETPVENPALNIWVGDFDLYYPFVGSPGFTNLHHYGLSVEIENLAVVEAVSGRPLDSAVDVQFDFTANGSIAADGSYDPIHFSPRSWEAIDPRVNWLQDHWDGDAGRAEHSWGLINHSATNYWHSHTYLRYLPQHRYPAVFASSNNRFYSPLELGNIHALDPDNNNDFSPWYTFRVLNHYDGENIVAPRHRILEHFTVVHTNIARRGLVNLNSMDAGVLRAAFDGVYSYGPGSGSVVSTNETGALVDLLIGHKESQGQFYSSTPEMLDMDWRGTNALANLPDITLNALATYSHGLLGVRQNLFLIVVSASTHTGDVVGVGRRRSAMAIVWRDPVPTAAGLHDHFTCYFRWLD